MNYEQYIKKSGKTLKQIQEETGISHAHLFRIRAGTSEPTASMIIKLCNALSCSADELLGLKEIPSEPARRGEESSNNIEQGKD